MSFLAHRLMLVLDHLIVGARTGLRQLHLGDKFLDDILPRDVLDGPHPLVDFRRQLHLRRRSRRRFRYGIISHRAGRQLLVGDRFDRFLVLAHCTLLLIDHDRTPFVESASRVQRIALQGNGLRPTTICRPVIIAKFQSPPVARQHDRPHQKIDILLI